MADYAGDVGPSPAEEAKADEGKEDEARERTRADASESNKATDAKQNDTKEEEDEETCGFCKFMKGGACKDVFVAWEQCVDSCRDKDGGDFVESCIDQTKLLKDCMEENADYYGIMLQAEEESKAAANEVNEAKEATGEPLKEGGND